MKWKLTAAKILESHPNMNPPRSVLVPPIHDRGLITPALRSDGVKIMAKGRGVLDLMGRCRVAEAKIASKEPMVNAELETVPPPKFKSSRPDHPVRIWGGGKKNQ